MNNLKKIILYPNVENDAGFELTQRVADILKKSGWQTVICPAFVDEAVTTGLPSGFTYSDLGSELRCAEMIITIGGDGTILRAARAAADLGVPILGINMGGKGFMAELEAEDIGLLESVAIEDCDTESRMMIDVELLRDGETITCGYALNDVVVKGKNKVIDMTIFGDDQRITHFSGDGAVIATPTGSTAYSMAAGGPILDTAAKNIIITPICAHLLEARSFVLVARRIVTVEIGYRKNNPAHISIDGGEYIDISSGDTVKIYKSERSTNLIRLSSKSHYRRVSEKLGERE